MYRVHTLCNQRYVYNIKYIFSLWCITCLCLTLNLYNKIPYISKRKRSFRRLFKKKYLHNHLLDYNYILKFSTDMMNTQHVNHHMIQNIVCLLIWEFYKKKKEKYQQKKFLCFKNKFDNEKKKNRGEIQKKKK